MFNDSTRAKNGPSNMALYPLLGPFYFGPFYTFWAPSTTTTSTPSWLLLLRPPSAHSWPSTTALSTPWPLYHSPFYTFLAPLLRPLLHLFGPSTRAPSTPFWLFYWGLFYTFLAPSSTTPSTLSWPLYCGILLHMYLCIAHNHVIIDVFLKKLLILGRFLPFFLHFQVPSHAGDLCTFLKLPQAFDVTYRRAKRIFI